jgi:hypothetical protein
MTSKPALLLDLNATPLGQVVPQLPQLHAHRRRAPADGGTDSFEPLTCEPESQRRSILLTEGAEPGLQVDGAVELAYRVAAQLSGKAGIIGFGNNAVEP